MEKKKLSRRERERLRHRQEILDTALGLFSEKGYHNVSMHEIAKSAEFGIGTVYKFFKNKEDLYKSLVLEQANKFHEALMRAIEEGEDEVEKLRNYVRVKGEVFRDNVAMIRLYFAETRGASFNVMAGLDDTIRKLYNEFLKRLSSVFEKGMKRKRFNRIADAYHLALCLDSISNAFLFLWLDSPEKHPYPEDPDVVLNVLFKGLVRQ